MNKERCDQTAMAVPNPTTTTPSTTIHQNSHDVNIVELQTTHYSRGQRNLPMEAPSLLSTLKDPG